MKWTTEKLNTTECPTTRVPTTGDAGSGETSKYSDEINDAQRAE